MLPDRMSYPPHRCATSGAPVVARRGPLLLALLGALLMVAPAACRGPAGGGAPDAAASRAGSGPPAAPNRFAADPLWDDGRAELNAYDATEMRDELPRPFTAYHIIVKEDFSNKQLVKADPGHDPADLMPVLKMNQVIALQTGIYSYHQMLSAFFQRSTMDLVKLSLTSFEWCGNSYKEYRRRDGRATLHVHTYWDGQSEATYDLPADAVFYDALPLWLRSLPQTPGLRRGLRLFPTQISSRGPKPEALPAALRAVAVETVTTPAGAIRATRWELRRSDPAPSVAGRAPAPATGTGTAGAAGEPPVTDVYWLAAESPYPLVAWDRADGGRYRLRWTQRLAYWELNAPGGERHLAGPH